MRIILLGAPGAGKGTQAQVLAERLGVPHIATGDLFRQARQSETEVGRLAASYMDRGELVPDQVVIRMAQERASQPDSRKGYILDGFPRTLEQAQAWDRALAERRESLGKVLYLKVSPEELVVRLSGRWICRTCQTPYHAVTSPPKVAGVCDRCGGPLYQREDDKPETVRRRLEVYFRETAPLVEYYERRGVLAEIDGERGVDAVRESMLEALEA